MLPYEEDVRIPMFVRLPVPPRARAGGAGGAIVISAPVINIDLAPSLLDLVGYGSAAKASMDGQSFIPALLQSQKSPPAASMQRSGAGSTSASASVSGSGSVGRSFLIEYFPIPHAGTDVQTSVKGTDGWCVDADCIKNPCPPVAVAVDSVNNLWACLRTLIPGQEDTIFCQFWDGTGYTQGFNRTSASHNFAEFYDMEVDPWQLANAAASMSATKVVAKVQRLHELMGCKGAGCESPSHP